MSLLQTHTLSDELTAALGASRCTSCGSTHLTDVFSARKLPIHVGNFYDNRRDALRAPAGDITLAFCRNCGFVYNRQFDPNKIDYRPGYEVALHHSPVFRQFMQGVVERLIERFDIRNQRVLEIGAGCAYFLKLLCETGENQGLGIDPTVATEGLVPTNRGRLELVRAYFGEQCSGQFRKFAPSLVCCLSVFEHIPQPARLLETLRRMIGDRRVATYFEIFNAFRALETQEVWSIHYEQCNYFSSATFAGLFQRSGFDVIESATCYQGDQYLFIDALPGDIRQLDAPASRGDELPLPPALADFSRVYAARIDFWRRELADMKRRRQRVVVWGTGGKGISFLNALDTHDTIEYVVEINPDKQGKYIPGTGQQIVPPAFLAEYRPDKVIITNALYKDEMKKQAAEIGVEPEFLVA